MIDIKFIPSGRGKAQCPPDPDYPQGKTVELTRTGQISCTVALPYPAPECGMFLVACEDCGLKILITAAGRPDDPISLTMPCLLKCKWCQEGNPRVQSSISSSFVHTDTPVGRVVCTQPQPRGTMKS
jgi:hypothetical protein